ncbi:monooxygenase [Novosphingobium sp. PC22D]|uniref:flavin-containing monooxygenase n=1 Tax=Novosphingobium sp. PC22D TaxID=1962403 RepID=UPI000BF23A90|nr:NAD(P)/FAD-dependent oxidoreductase [Novosphingobium sp. PC22D]PEQ14262.1 monooxygenase [Novosphingobium sp. PC22D]
MSDTDIDLDELERRYAQERDKRLRSDGMAQYEPLGKRFAALARDPHADPDFKRAPIEEDGEVLIIGGGFAGLLAGARLREQGVDAIRIIEKGADFGGTWYWNRYPGAACDVESTVYLPMLEELGHVPTERYPRGSEIQAYCGRIAERYDLRRAALFQTLARKLRWDAGRARWIVETDRGDRIAARFVISCTGLLSNPKLPRIPGIETFAGHAFHTSRWDYAYTGGDESGGLTGLADKVVGIIGTGSTGVQVIPHLAAWAKHLYVFQRTPASVEVRANRPLTDDDFAGLEPGWQRQRRDNFTTLTGGGYAPVDLVGDSWTDIIRSVMPRLENGEPVADVEAIRRAEMRKAEGVRQRVAATVRDPETAEALKPWFHYFCKRPCFHDEYLESFNRPNVTLVDTQGKGVERFTPAGAVVAGTEYPLDCLVLATGFDFLVDYCEEAGLEIVGDGGVDLSDRWADGPLTLHGMQTHGFPNFFMMAIAQAGAAVNYVHTADEQTQTIAQIIAETRERGATRVEPSLAAETAWVETIVEGAKARRAFLESCTPGYYSYEGRRERKAALNDFYAGGPMAYIEHLRDWRDAGGFPGLDWT